MDFERQVPSHPNSTSEVERTQDDVSNRFIRRSSLTLFGSADADKPLVRYSPTGIIDPYRNRPFARELP